MKPFLALALPTAAALALSAPALAQIVPQGGSFQSLASAFAPGCSDNDGGPGVSPAAAACVDGQGYAAAGSSSSSFSATVEGGDVFVHTEASATSIGPPASSQSNGAASAFAAANWLLSADTYYSLSIATQGGATAVLLGVPAGPVPASGTLAPGNYGLSASSNVNATARDSNGAETVTAIPETGSARITLAEVASPTLIRGTITAGGVGMPGLLVEAFDGPALEGSALTGDDGSYLLANVGVPVVVTASDPSGGFLPAQSGLITPPGVFDADLAPAAVPALPIAALVMLSASLVVTARRLLVRQASA